MIKDRDKGDEDWDEDMKGVPQGIIWILNSKDEGYEKHGKKQKQGIKFVKAQEEDKHGPDINPTHAYLVQIKKQKEKEHRFMFLVSL